MDEGGEVPPAPLGAIEIVPIGAVCPYERNPRQIPQRAVTQCAESIREFGWQQPIVVDKDMVILAGHTRFKAAQALRLQHVPVTIAAELTSEQARAFRIADNRTHDYASWDFPLLITELDGLDADFSGVLDLADWKAIVSEFESADVGQSSNSSGLPESLESGSPSQLARISPPNWSRAKRRGGGVPVR